jgi:hypothetical protein
LRRIVSRSPSDGLLLDPVASHFLLKSNDISDAGNSDGVEWSDHVIAHDENRFYVP